MESDVSGESPILDKIFPASTIPPVLDRVSGVESNLIKLTLLVFSVLLLIHYTPYG